jgi:adenosylcobinamide kinase / adenosylcobinamide-phosphate guanylyltransferase
MSKARRERSKLILVLGGAASGKSQAALDVARGQTPPQAGPVPVPVRMRKTPRTGAGKGVSPRFAFVATGQALDREMKVRIERHQATRPSDWETVEIPTDLATWFSVNGNTYQLVIIDCLTLWLSNMKGQRLPDSAICNAAAGLLKAIRKTKARVVVVSNELGLGLVPATKPVRAFRDLAGRINQQVAAEADEVYLVVSGLPLRLK